MRVSVEISANRDRNPFVFLVKGQKAIKHTVSIGRLINNQIEITSGLSEGDVIVSKGADRLFDGDPIQVEAGGNSK